MSPWYVNEIAHFVDRVQHNRQLQQGTTGFYGLKALTTTMAIYESADKKTISSAFC